MPKFNRIVGSGDAPRTGPWFTASYDGECAQGCQIREGDQICADGEGGWLCGDCGEEAKERERGR